MLKRLWSAPTYAIHNAIVWWSAGPLKYATMAEKKPAKKATQKPAKSTAAGALVKKALS